MKALAGQISELDGVVIYGRVVGVRGLMVEVAGPLHAMSVGARVVVETPGKPIPCEVVGFSGGNALLMPFAPLEGLRRGCRAVVTTVAGAALRRAGWGASLTHSASRLTARVPCCSDHRPVRSATRRRSLTLGGGSGCRSISACGRLTLS
jgi:flagellar biosynthesis/type III secretory pathway ATPase